MLDVGVAYFAVLEAYETFRLQSRGIVGGDDSTARYDVDHLIDVDLSSFTEQCCISFVQDPAFCLDE